MICTITPPPDCLARLAACPALPRGERLEWAQGNRAPGYAHRIYRGGRGFLWLYASRVGAHRDSHSPTAGQAPEPTTITTWRSMARPLRVARERLREARRVIDGVAMDMDDASYREDDCSHVRAMKKARDDLYAALRTP